VKRTCKQCSCDFRVDILEAEWCRTQGLSLPRLCLGCRAERRGVESAVSACSECSSSFQLPAQCVFLARLLSWADPTQCATCAADKPASNRSRQLWELNARLQEPLIDDTAAGRSVPSLPEDLFKDFDKLTNSDRFVAAKSSEEPVEANSLADGVGPPPNMAQPSTDSVPSPDALFKSLAGPKRRSG